MNVSVCSGQLSECKFKVPKEGTLEDQQVFVEAKELIFLGIAFGVSVNKPEKS